MTHFLDLPNPHDPKGPWIHIMSGSKSEVLTFAKNVFGADDDGCINIVSAQEDEELDEDGQ